MCAIYGETHEQVKDDWLDIQKQKALVRGTDWIECKQDDVAVYHTRLATNDSKDKYPIKLGSDLFAMNGIVHQKQYEHLQSILDTWIEDYTVDSAYLLLHLQCNSYDFASLDSLDYVFAFWLLHNGKLILANKDYPLYIQRHDGGLRFSSFHTEGFEPLGNKAVMYDLKDKHYTELYTFEHMVYDN